MVRFRTIRQRRLRARKGQVAAVATVLGLLLVTTFLANYLQQQLPAALTAAEFDHVLQVENQLARLQATINAQARSQAPGLVLASPITLGSAAAPPFGPPTTGIVTPEAASSQLSTAYALGATVPALPNWGAGSACLTNGAGTCSTVNAVNWWNVSNVNSTAFTVTISASGNSLYYNLTGSNDTLTLQWNGGNTQNIFVVVNGSNDKVNYNKAGTDTNAPRAQFWFYGSNDQFNLNPTGSVSSAQGSKILVRFVGSQSGVCPFGNRSNTDSVKTLTSGGTNLNLTVIWSNSLGYRSGPHAQTYPGGSGKNETIYWSNQTGVQTCAFSKMASTMYHAAYAEGIFVHLYNRYLPPTDIVFDQGAVIESQLGGNPVMFSPLELTQSRIPAGYTATLTLVNLVANFTNENGLATAAVLSRVASAQTFTVANGRTADSLTSSLYLNVTTAYPTAWITFLQSQPGLFPFGVTCTPSGALSLPYSCAHPPPGVFVQVAAPMAVVQLTVTSITVVVTIT